MCAPRKCSFKIEWLSDPEFKSWIKKCEDSHSAFCTMCKKTIDLTNMGVSALKSHKKGAKHIKLAQAMDTTKPVKSYFKSSAVTSDKEEEPSSSALSTHQGSSSWSSAASSSKEVGLTSQQSLREKCMISENVLKSEILWTLSVAKKHMSLNSCNGLNNLFSAMFPDSEIAKSFSCAPTKCSYLLYFGIAQYFKDKLYQQISKCEFFSLCFDGSVNKFIQKDQVDIIIRFWDEEAQIVTSRYLDSQFLGHATAADLVKALQGSMEELNSAKLLQIGMDGPNVNLKALKDLIMNRETMYPEYPRLIDVGSCSIHTLHRSFEVGAEQTGWDLATLLRALWQILKDSPARKSDFLALNEIGLMPLKFCATRWVEDVAVSDRAITIWPSVVKFIESCKDKPRSEVVSKSFQIVKEATKDPLVVAKLSFFSFVGKQMQPYLKGYQTDEPMLPFQAIDVLKLLYNLMSLFVKKDVLDKSNTDFALCSVDFDKKENLQFSNKVETGFAVREILSKLLKEKKVNEKEVSVFKLECQMFLKALVKKVIDKNPLKYPVVRFVMCLEPKSMVADKSKTIETFTKLLQELQKRKIMLPMNCDSALSELKLLFTECPITEFSKFERSNDRIDSFYYDIIGAKKQYSHLWKVIKIVLTLSHGQASVERGFSLNKEIVVENLKEESLVALRLVCDELKSVDLHEVPITKELLSYARSARMRYQNYLDDQKKKKNEEEKTKKRTLKTEKLKSMKKRKLNLENAIETMTKEADAMALKAENKKDFTLLAKSNSFRLKTTQMAADVEKINKEIIELSKEC